MDTPSKPAFRSPGLAGLTSRGMMWMMVSAFVTKGGSFAAQVVLGWILLKEDFGIYAIAISVASLVQVFKDGGTRKIIIQRGARRFERLCKPVFWMATGFNVLTAVVLAALAYPVSLLYSEPRLIEMLLILALSSLLGTPDSMYRAWLSAQLRFRELAAIHTWQGLIKSGSMIALAIAGAGATSFVWPMVLHVLLGWWLGRRACGPLPLEGSVRFRIWPLLLKASLWLFVGSSALLMIKQGPYMILGLFHDPAIIGVYFFAFQLLLQINQMIALNFQSVLLPTLSAVQKNLGRHAYAVLRTSEVLVLISTLVALSICVGIYDAVVLVWGEKWVEAVPAIHWMGLFFPFRMFHNLIEPALLSRGKYRPWAWLMCLQAIIVLAATLVAGFYTSTAAGFAMMIGAGFMCSTLAITAISMRWLNVALWDLARKTLPVYLVGALLYGAVLYLRDRLGMDTPVAMHELVIRGALVSSAYSIAYLALLRILLPGSLRTMYQAMPERIGGPLRRVLLLPPDGPHRSG